MMGGKGLTIAFAIAWTPLILVAPSLHAGPLTPPEESLNIEFFDPGMDTVEEEPTLHMVIYDEDGQPEEEAPREIIAEEPPTEEFSATVYLEGGYRHDDINWNKAAPGGTPNVLSELTWSDVEIALFEVGTHMTLFNDWIVEGKAAFGAIAAGDNQDSDYFGNDRTFEFSRSNNNTDSGTTLDLSLGLGYQFRFGTLPRLQFAPKVGFSYHAQNLNITDGYQTIPAFGSFSGLDSEYDTNWYGPWAGLETQVQLTERLDLSASVEYHVVRYEGRGNWNLRDDLEHPVSFEQKAWGDGVTATAKTRYAITPYWRVSLSADYQSWSADEDGEDHMFFADGSEAFMRFNEVNWDSYGFNLGIEYDF